MHVKPVRYQNQRSLHFTTFSCYRRMKLLDSVTAREAFETELERVRRWYGCSVIGYVVMPEHVHLLLREPERGKFSLGDPDSETNLIAQVEATGSPAILAGALLRLSCLERRETDREATLHPSQPSHQGISATSGGLEVEQLCTLCDRNRANSGD